MEPIRTSIFLDSDVKEKIIPLLKRNGMTLSSFVRKTMADYVENYERVSNGETQLDPRIANRK